MTRPDNDLKQEPAVVPSPLQSLVQEALGASEVTERPLPHSRELYALAVQIQHNLRYQHSWSDITIHTHSPIHGRPLPRPLLSGLPSQRLYVHPDEQIELLKHADKKRKAKKDAEGTLEVDVAPEREWVLPTRLSEKWTLRRLSEVFDGLSLVPPEPQKEGTDGERSANPWRTTKRVVLATADADSTVVYYILHDGVVKPRQN